MSTQNAVNTTLSGQTGTGNFVGATSPTLVTPTLGAASATSINFGGSSLSTYAATTAWTPVFTFATPGNLSVSYTIQAGYYARIGSIVIASYNINCTPTFSTSSGVLQITGLPFTSNSSTNNSAIAGCYFSGTINLGSYTTLVSYILPNTSYLTFYALASNTVESELTSTTFTSGDACAFAGTAIYLI